MDMPTNETVSPPPKRGASHISISALGVPAFLVDIRSDGAALYAGFNDLFAACTGLDPSPMLGQTPGHCLPETIASAVARHYQICARSGQPLEYEMLAELPAGKRRWRTRLIPIRLSGKRVDRLLGLMSDVFPEHAEKNEAAAADARESLIAALLDAAPTGIVTADSRGSIEVFNAAAERIFGRQRSDAIGRNLKILMPEPTAAQHESYIQRYLDGGAPRVIGVGRDVVASRADGGEFPVNLAVGRFEDQGAVKFVGIITDMSERFAQEQELRTALIDRNRAEREERDSRERLQLAIEGADISLWEFDPQTGHLTSDERLLRKMGYAPGEVQPLLDAKSRLVHPEDRPHALKLLQDHVADASGSFATDLRVLDRSGAWRWIAIRGRVMERDAAGRALRVRGSAWDMTQQKQSELALSESRERLDMALRGADLGLWDLDMPTGNVVYGERWAGMLGYTVDELEPRVETWERLVHPDDLPRTKVAFGEYLAGLRAHYEVEFRMRTKSGEWRWIRSRGAVMQRDQAGAPSRIVGAHHDITTRKHAEAALAASRERLEAALDGAEIGLWETDLRTGEMSLDSRLCRLLGCGIDELEHRIETWSKAIHPEDRPRAEAVWNDYVAGKTDRYESEYRIVKKSGATMWVWDHGRIVERDPEGRPLRAVGTALDITQRKQVELALHESEARFHNLADTMPAFVWQSDEEDRCVFVNRTWLHYTGRKLEQELGRGWMESVHPDDLGKHMELEQKHVRQRTAYASDYRLCSKEGEYRWFFDRAIPRHAEDGTFLGYVGVLLDIEDRRALEDQLRQAQKMEAIGQLAGGIAHDFNNLLLVILVNLDMIREEATGSLRERAALAMSATERGADLTQRLLAFGRRQILEPKPVGIGDVINGMTGLLRRTFGENITIETCLTQQPPTAIVDRGQLENALLNLALNARDAMPRGGNLRIEAGEIELRDAEASAFELGAGRYATIAVSDTGTGIPPEILTRVFEPFFTTKEVGKGTGLGLSMVHGFVRQSGGAVRIESEPGRGTTVRLYLRAAPPAAIVSSPSKAAELPRGTETVLVVEDDDEVRRTVTQQLTSLGYSVFSATNGPNALTMLRSLDKLDLVMTDLVMPGGLSGRDLAHELRKLRPDIKVLLSTGYSPDPLQDDREIEAILPKPYLRADLARTLREILDSPKPR